MAVPDPPATPALAPAPPMLATCSSCRTASAISTWRGSSLSPLLHRRRRRRPRLLPHISLAPCSERADPLYRGLLKKYGDRLREAMRHQDYLNIVEHVAPCDAVEEAL